MDASLPDRPLRRLALGRLEGSAIGAVVSLALPLLHQGGTLSSWRVTASFALFGLIAGALSQLLARGILGACVGLVAGAVFGSVIADDLPRPTLARHHLGMTAQLDGITLAHTHYDITSRRGMVVLVDFWSTTCPLCRQEMPRLKQLDERYRQQGFEIVGVSLDQSKRDLSAYVEKEKIDWPQIVAEDPSEQGWKNPALFRYTVQSLPYTLLVDRDGTIVASGLVGSDLEEAVETVMAGRKLSISASGFTEPDTVYCAVIGCLAGILVHRRLRQIAPSKTASA